MVYVALDLSINSTGICIADSETRQCIFTRLTPAEFDKITGTKFVVSEHNASQVAKAICKELMPWRFAGQFHVVIETVGFGFLHRQTNSATTLLFEGGIVASELRKHFNATLQFVEPTLHKKRFTGKGNASKELSIGQMLQWFPQLGNTADKLDDMADAMSLMTVAVPDIRTYECKFHS